MDLFVQKSAAFSPDRVYRYSLSRTWGDGGYAMFVGLNPSTADEENDDPTIRRCIGYARDWGHGGLVMANLFAYRATLPKDMMKAADPVGPDNDGWLRDLAEQANIVIAAWGKDGVYRGRANVVRKVIPNLHYLRLSGKTGQPWHPLYLPKDLRPVEWAPA